MQEIGKSVLLVSTASTWILILSSLCFRQSIDLYSSVPSPNIGFLNTPSLSRLSSSFLSSSLTRRHTPEILPSVTKPLLQPTTDEQQRRSSHNLLPPIPSRRPSIKKDEKASGVSHGVPISRQCSYGQAVLNGMKSNLGYDWDIYSMAKENQGLPFLPSNKRDNVIFTYYYL